MKRLLIGFCVLGMLVGRHLVAPVSATSQPSLWLWPDEPRQGEVVLLRAYLGPDGGAARWFGEHFPLHRQGELWWVLLPIPIGAPVGLRPLALRYTLSGGVAREAIGHVDIRKAQRPVQRLRVSRATNALYSAAEAKAERAAIGAAIRSETGPAGCLSVA